MKKLLTLTLTLLAITMQAQYYKTTPTEIWDKVPSAQKAKALPVVRADGEHWDEVTCPTLEKFEPAEGTDNKQAIIVCPGGAYNILAYVKEGQEIAEWLSKQGYTAYVLAYRVPKQREGALQDLYRSIRLVRAEKNYEKVGCIGFSAGASLCCRAATNFTKETYQHTDKADKQNQRPDFAMLIYPAYLADGENQTLTPELTVSKETCPLFVWGTQDDVHSGPSSVTIMAAMQKHQAPIELHYHVKGGHGYGMRGDGAGKIWPALAEQWLKTQR